MKICISFKTDELELLEYIKTKRSASNYIKDLVEDDMKKNRCGKKEEKIIESDNSGVIW